VLLPLLNPLLRHSLTPRDHTRHQIPFELLSWRLARDKTVADGLLEITRLRDMDTLVCGIAGYSQKKLGSVSDELTHHATCNTIVIKVRGMGAQGHPATVAYRVP
jgi:nucleotide-binding universal stress UspA family protein